MTVTADTLLAERLRAMRHAELGLASGAYQVAIDAIRSGAPVESVVPEHIRAAARAGRTEELEAVLAHCGITAARTYSIVTADPSVAGAGAPASARLAQPTRDLGDLIVEIIEQQGGL